MGKYDYDLINKACSPTVKNNDEITTYSKEITSKANIIKIHNVFVYKGFRLTETNIDLNEEVEETVYIYVSAWYMYEVRIEYKKGKDTKIKIKMTGKDAKKYHKSIDYLIEDIKNCSKK